MPTNIHIPLSTSIVKPNRMLTDGRELLIEIGIGFCLEAETLEMRVNKVKNVDVWYREAVAK